MSKRTMKKVMDQRNAEVVSVEPEEIIVEEPKKKNFFNKAFLMNDSESDHEEKIEQNTEVATDKEAVSQQKRKKKNKKNKEKAKEENKIEEPIKDEDLDFLEKQMYLHFHDLFNRQLNQTEESKNQEPILVVGKTELRGCLDIILSKLNYNKEIQRHFKNAKLTESDVQRVKGKKPKIIKQHKLIHNQDVKMQLHHKFQCDQVDLNEQGLMTFKFVAAPSYESVQKEYEVVKKSLNPQQMFDFLQYHPQHCQTLYDVSEYFRLKGDYKQANELLEILLYIYEESLGYTFIKVFEEPIVCRELEHNEYSQTFFMTLFKFTDILSKKGCYRSALEFSKVLLKLAPTTDPTGALLLIDYHSLSAQQYEYLIYLTANFGKEVYKHSKYSLAYMPSLLYNCAIAKFLILRKEYEEVNKGDYQPTITEADFKLAIDNFREEKPLDASANVLLIQAILLYPSAILEVGRKNEYIKQHVSNCDSFIGWQRKPIKELLELDFLARETYLYWFLGLENEEDEAGLKKSIEIFAERNKIHWKHSHIIQWVKGVVGLIQNKIEDKSIDLMAFYQSVSCLDEETKGRNYIPFQFRRYKSLVKTHFSDQTERLDFNNLFAENIGAQQIPQQHPQFRPINANQGMLGVIFQSLFPWVHNPLAGQVHQGHGLEQEEFEDFQE